MLPALLFRALPSRLGLVRGTSPTGDAKVHAAPGLLGRALGVALAAELAWLRGGRNLRLGASLLFVAEKR